MCTCSLSVVLFLFYVDPYWLRRRAFAPCVLLLCTLAPCLLCCSCFMLILICCAGVHLLSLSPIGFAHFLFFCSTLGFIPQPSHACMCSLRGGLLLVGCFARRSLFFAHVCTCCLFVVFSLLSVDPHVLRRRTFAPCLLLVCALAPYLLCRACFMLILSRCRRVFAQS